MHTWAKDQHFMPQAYLRLFSHDQENIWVYDSTNQTFKSQRIKDTGFRKYFYLSRMHPAPLDIPEVSKLEGEATVVIKNIEELRTVTPAELGCLLNFIVLQFLRTPAGRKRIESGLGLFWQGLRKHYRKLNPNKIKQRAKAEAIAQSFITDQKILNLAPREFLEKDVEIKPPAEFFPEAIPILGQRYIVELANQGWEFLYAGSDEEFLTTDDPLALIESEKTAQGFYLGKDVAKIIPLSKKVCLNIGGSKRKVARKFMLPWAVGVINLGIANLADQYIYSSNKTLLEKIIKDLPKFRQDSESFITPFFNS